MMTRVFALPALVATIAIMPSSVFAVNDGTYKTVNVTSVDQCSAMCDDDNLCRGWSLVHLDTRTAHSQCSLNNGIGAQSPFPVDVPDPVDAQTVIKDINAYRKKHDLKPLTWNQQLVTASQIHSDDLAQSGTISHQGSDGSYHAQRIERFGYEYSIAVENVATGQKDWDDVFKAWQDSPGHNENLLRETVTEIGVAVTHEPTTQYVNYWTMVIAAPLGEPVVIQQVMRH